MNRRYDPRAAYLPGYSPSRQAREQMNVLQSTFQPVTQSKFPDYNEDLDDIGDYLDNHNYGPMTNPQPLTNAMNQLQVTQPPTQQMVNPVVEPKPMKIEMIKHNYGATNPSYSNKDYNNFNGDQQRDASPLRMDLNPPSRNKSPVLSHLSNNSRSHKELEPTNLLFDSQGEKPQGFVNTRSPRSTYLGQNQQSKNFAIFDNDSQVKGYEAQPPKRSAREQQLLDALPNDAIALKTQLASKDAEVRYLKEKIDLLKEAAHLKTVSSTSTDREKIEQFKLEQLDRDLKAARKETTYLTKEVDRYKNESKRQTDLYNQKVYSIKVNFDVEQRKTMEQIERNIVFKHADRNDHEVNMLMNRLSELESMAK